MGEKKIFESYSFDRGLMSRTYKQQSTSQPTKQQMLSILYYQENTDESHFKWLSHLSDIVNMSKGHPYADDGSVD